MRRGEWARTRTTETRIQTNLSATPAPLTVKEQTTTNERIIQMTRDREFTYEVLRDDEILEVFSTYAEAMAHLHRIQPHSVAWATEHEGYAIKEQSEIIYR